MARNPFPSFPTISRIFSQKVTRYLARQKQKLRRATKRIASRPSLSSLKSATTTVKYDTSRVPPEIWLRILREATLMDPNPLDFSSDVSFIEPEPSCSYDLESYYENLYIKRQVALVCRQWNALSRSFLFEYVWIEHALQAKRLAHTLIMEFVRSVPVSSGWHIRRLHIDTSILDRCAPIDIQTILDYSPRITSYTDSCSLERNVFETPDPRCCSHAILTHLAECHRDLQRLTWTKYDDLPMNVHMLSLFTRPSSLQYLEITAYSPTYAATRADSISICLPVLHSLKLQLDDMAFADLAEWDMPSLRTLSVVSCEFNYSGKGFSSFFRTHGTQLDELELGHSSSLIESETNHELFSLGNWCPNLRSFICSAESEWHWQTPDWIPPHVLMPSHPKIEFIGIRGIDTRLMESDNTFTLLEQLSSLQRGAFPSLRFIRDLSVYSHKMRTCRPEPRVVRFWSLLLGKCQQQGVWLEDMYGMNITARTLKRASLDLCG